VIAYVLIEVSTEFTGVIFFSVVINLTAWNLLKEDEIIGQ
jgi:hypothetical protein